MTILEKKFLDIFQCNWIKPKLHFIASDVFLHFGTMAFLFLNIKFVIYLSSLDHVLIYRRFFSFILPSFFSLNNQSLCITIKSASTKTCLPGDSNLVYLSLAHSFMKH